MIGATMLLATLLIATSPQSRSLIGTWAYVDAYRGTLPPIEPCATDNGVRYDREGRWSDLMDDEQGTWALRGDLLSERVTHRHDDAQVSRAVNEPVSRYRLRWHSPDHITVGRGTEAYGLVRCP